MQEIKKIDKKSLANIMGAFYALSGLAVFMAIIISSIINIIIVHDYSGSAFKVILFNIGLGLILGIFVGAITGLFGWAIGYVWAALYNLIVMKTGGIKIELAKESAQGGSASGGEETSPNKDLK